MQPTIKDLEEKEELLIEVMNQLYRDVRDGEGQAIYEMIERLPDYVLKGYLNEAEHHEKLRWN